MLWDFFHDGVLSHTEKGIKWAYLSNFSVLGLSTALSTYIYIIGSSHDFVDLQVLADQFVKLINDMKLWIFDKEECLLGLFKQLTRILSDWDSDTEEMITKLHNARDKQVCKNIS